MKKKMKKMKKNEKKKKKRKKKKYQVSSFQLQFQINNHNIQSLFSLVSNLVPKHKFLIIKHYFSFKILFKKGFTMSFNQNS